MNFADKPWIIIKLGGSSQDEEMIRQIAFSIKKVLELNFKIALIHGGGPAINEALLGEKELTWEFIEGQRKTTPEMMQVIEATLFGKVKSQKSKDYFLSLMSPFWGFQEQI